VFLILLRNNHFSSVLTCSRKSCVGPRHQTAADTHQSVVPADPVLPVLQRPVVQFSSRSRFQFQSCPPVQLQSSSTFAVRKIAVSVSNILVIDRTVNIEIYLSKNIYCGPNFVLTFCTVTTIVKPSILFQTHNISRVGAKHTKLQIFSHKNTGNFAISHRRPRKCTS